MANDWLYAGTLFLSVTGGAATYYTAIAGGAALANTTEANTQVKLRSAFTAKDAYVQTAANTRTSASTLSSRKNTAAGNLSVSLTASTTGEFTDTTHTDSIASADVYNYALAVVGSTGGVTLHSYNMTLEESSGISQLITADPGNITGNGTSVSYQTAGGRLLIAITTEASQKATARTAMTLSNFQIRMSAAASFGVTPRTRKNTANGAQSVTPGTSTGFFEDTTHTDSIAVTDVYNFQISPITSFGGTSTFMSCLSTSASQVVGGSSENTGRSVTSFYGLQGANVATSSETAFGAHMTLPMKMQNMYVVMISNSHSGGTVGVVLRDQQANSGVGVSFAASTAGILEDTTNTVIPTANDKVNWSTVVTAGSGVYSTGVIQCELTVASTTWPRNFSRSGAMTLAFNRAVITNRSTSRTGAMTLAFARKGNAFKRPLVRAGAMTLAFNRKLTTARTSSRTGTHSYAFNRKLTAVRFFSRLTGGAGASTRGVFYYPWFTVGGDPGFPGAWTQSFSPWTQFHPKLGYYDSATNATIDNHIRAMEYARFDVVIVSWWGQGSREDTGLGLLLARAAAIKSQLKFCVYYEAEGNTIGGVTGSPDPTSAQITSDLNYIATNYGSNPFYLKKANKPVIFAYGDGGDGTQSAPNKPTVRWAVANAAANTPFYTVLKVWAGYTGEASQPDSWHQYGPASATDSQGAYSYTISPGFWLATESTARLARLSAGTWATNIASMLASGAEWLLVTSFNEWGEGHAVEDADGNSGHDYTGGGWDSASGFGTYLDGLAAGNGFTRRSDSVTRALIAARTLARIGSISETFVRHGTFKRTLSRAGAMTLAFNRAKTQIRTSSRSGAMTLAFVRHGTFKRTLARSGTVVSSFARTLTTKRTSSRSGSMVAVFSRATSTYRRALSRSGAMTLAFAVKKATARTYSRSGSMTATFVRHGGFARALSRSGAMTATFVRHGTFLRSLSRVGTHAYAFVGLRVKNVSMSRAGTMTATFVRHGGFKRTSSRAGAQVMGVARSVIARRSNSRTGSINEAFVRLVVYRRTSARTGAMTQTYKRVLTARRVLSRAGSMTAIFARKLTYIRTSSRAGSMTLAFARKVTFRRALSRIGHMTIAVAAGTSKTFGFTRIGHMTMSFGARVGREILARVTGRDLPVLYRSSTSDVPIQRVTGADVPTERTDNDNA